MDEVLVVLNDCGEPDILRGYDVLSGVRYVTIKNNIYEYGAHIGIIKAVQDKVVPRTNDFIVLHDTCIAGKNFKTKCLDLQGSSDAQIVWATAPDNNWHNGGAFNIGIYRYESVEYVNNLLRDIMNMDKNFAIEMELNKNHMSIKKTPIDQSFSNLNAKIIGQFDAFGEGRKRDVAYIESLDLYKFFLWVAHGDHHPNRI